MLRVALFGFGLGGQVFHAPFLTTTPGLSLDAIVTSDEERAALAAERYPHARRYAHPDALFADADRFDLAVVTTANAAHVPLGLAALEHGLHVVVDKPLAGSAAEAARLVEAAEDAGRVLTVFQNRRWDADFLTLRRLVGAGELGEVFRLESRFERWRPGPVRPAWRESGDPAAGGGVLFDLGSHLVDQACVLLGPVLRVYGEVRRLRPGAEVDHEAFVAVTHAGGATSHHSVASLVAAPGPRLRALGTGGAYVTDPLEIQEAQLRAGMLPTDPAYGVEPPERWGALVRGDERTVVPTERGAWPRFYEGVVAAVERGAPAPVDPRDAVHTLEVLEAARRSAATGEVVTVG